MQFYEINIRNVIILKLYTVCNKHDMIQIIKITREKSKVSKNRKCSNNFAANCAFLIGCFLFALPKHNRTYSVKKVKKK